VEFSGIDEVELWLAVSLKDNSEKKYDAL